MPHAVVLNTASKASTTGGTFADTLTANNLDSLSVPSLQSGEGKIIRMWGIDSASVAELALTRPPRFHRADPGLHRLLPLLRLGQPALRLPGRDAVPLHRQLLQRHVEEVRRTARPRLLRVRRGERAGRGRGRRRVNLAEG